MKVIKQNGNINYRIVAALMVICLTFSITALCQTETDNETAQKKLETQVEKDCIEYKEKFDAMKAWVDTHKKITPEEIPVPPVLYEDCHDCKEQGYEDRNQPVIDAFIKKSTQPESDFIGLILEIARTKELLLGVDNSGGTGLFPDHYVDNTDHYSCLKHLDNYEMKEMLYVLEGRMYDKISMMRQKYGREGEYFKAGAALYLSVLRSLALLGYNTDEKSDLAELAFWSTKFYEKTRDRLFKQFQYQLYPGIFYIPRDMMMLGVDESYFAKRKLTYDGNKYKIEKEDGVVKTFNEAISFMHFKLKINYMGNGRGQNGDMVKVRFNGEVELRCRVNGSQQEPCFEWVPESGGSMTFKIEQAEFQGHDKEVITYSGPVEFSVPVQFYVNMCDDQPLFRMTFDRLWPQEEHYKHNQAGELNTPMLYHLISATLGSANTENLKKEVDKLKSQSGKYNEAEMEAWNARMEAHGNDSSYFKTEQGRKDLAMARQLKKQFGSVSKSDQKKMQQLKDIKKSMEQKHDTSYVAYFEDQQKLKQAANDVQKVMQRATGGAMSLNKLELPFKPGSDIPVDGILGNSGGKTSLTVGSGQLNYSGSFKITLENTPDEKDNLKY